MKKFNKYSIAACAIIIAGMGIASTFALGAKKATVDTSTAATAAAQPAAAPANAAAAKTDDANTVLDKGWTERCNSKEKKPNKKNCEVYSRLEMKGSAMRVAEIAIGFPQDDTLKDGAARGVIILPLGIMLEPGATMQVDSGKPVAFKSRFCTASGCFSIVNLSKDILEPMKTGKYLNVFFKTAENRDAHLVMNLAGFDKIISKIE